MQRPRLVASDVDGTLLGPSEKITVRTRAVIHRVIRAEVPFILVTGRPPRWLPPITTQLGHHGMAVCANGAVLYDAATGQILHTETMSVAQLRRAADAVRTALPLARMAVELPADGSPDGPEFFAEPGYIHPWPGSDSQLVALPGLLRRPAIKMLVRQRGVPSDALAGAVAGHMGGELSTTFSTAEGLIEISAAGVTKASGLARIAAELCIAASDVLAFGDMPNDLPMLDWAGWGVAMANGHASVLEAADEVTGPNHEDGLATVLERWF